jgi:hypothetical protein
MQTVKVEVQEDHLSSLSHVKKPIIAIAELIWNGLDADAEEVKIAVKQNQIGGIDSIRVVDDGHGLDIKDAPIAFGYLGGSWKKQTRTSKKNRRLLHGKAGKGRFRAFSIGKVVRWKTRYQEGENIISYEIEGDSDRIGEFRIGDSKLSGSKKTGTEVEITEIRKHFVSLLGTDGAQEITEQFSLYMTQYHNVRIKYDGVYIDPSAAMEKITEYELEGIEGDTVKPLMVRLTIIEWKNPTERKLYLCDLNGFTYHDIPPGIHAPGFNFSGYLKAERVRELEDAALLEFEEWDPTLKKMLEAAKKKMKEHFHRRSSEIRKKIVEGWKEEGVYPYEGTPRNIIERTERQVFELCAIQMAEYLPNFNEIDAKNKSLSFKLLRYALETSPTAVRRILSDVLDLPEEKHEEFAQLIEKISLEGMMTVSKVVADRLEFLRGLEMLVFDPVSKQQLLERRQLHKIVSPNTWIFGEEFHLTIDDKSLTEVLKKHLALLGKEIEVDQPVKQEDGTEGIVDLMVSRLVPQPRADEREHLVIEMKRPKQKIDNDAANQIKKYAFAIAEDERFRDSKTRWTFWGVSNEISNEVRKEAKQKDRPEGLLYADEEGKMSIWVKTWGQIINDCRARLNFFQETLKYRASDETALEYLRKEYEKYLPGCFSEETREVSGARK